MKFNFKEMMDVSEHKDARIRQVLVDSDMNSLEDMFGELADEEFENKEALDREMIAIIRDAYYDEDFYQHPWDVIENYMDDDIRENMHNNYGDLLSEKEFYDAYCERHEEKFNEEFRIN